MALHAAARDGNLEELQKLIAAKQDLNERDKHHRTPLVMASWAGKVECVKLLLEAGANIKAFAMDDMNAMHFAAQKGHAEVVRQLLNAGLSVNSKTRKGTNALQFAAKQGHLNVVELLIKRHANVKAADRNQKTALDLTKDDAIREALQAALQEQKQEGRPDAKKADHVGDSSAAAEQKGQENTAVPAEKAAVDELAEPQPAVGHAEDGSAPNGGGKSERRNVRKRADEAGEEELHGDTQPSKRTQKVSLSHLDEEEEDEGG